MKQGLHIYKLLDKNLMIAFESETVEESRAYNYAIATVGHPFRVFHQMGREDEIGYHGWEIWVEATEEDLEALFPEIEKEVQAFTAERW